MHLEITSLNISENSYQLILKFKSFHIKKGIIKVEYQNP